MGSCLCTPGSGMLLSKQDTHQMLQFLFFFTSSRANITDIWRNRMAVGKIEVCNLIEVDDILIYKYPSICYLIFYGNTLYDK